MKLTISIEGKATITIEGESPVVNIGGSSPSKAIQQTAAAPPPNPPVAVPLPPKRRKRGTGNPPGRPRTHPTPSEGVSSTTTLSQSPDSSI